MPTINRKRRAQAEPEASPPPTRRRQSPSASDATSDDDNIDGEAEDNTQAGNQEQMVKKLVRLALASEYSRTPIRRNDISSKVMPPGTGRQFKTILYIANEQLRTVFGMELTTLPQKEKVTVSQKRAAQRAGTQSQASSSNTAYILTSTLPAQYRVPNILPPAKIPTTAAEASYVGLTTFILSLIYLSPSSSISEARLEKHLKRMNAESYAIGGEKTETILKRMIKEGYIIRVRERDGGGEETVDFMIGPRGKAEVGERGIAGLVRKVYGKKDAEADELEKRLVRSLGDVVLQKKRAGGEEMNDGEDEDEAEGAEGEENGSRDGEGENETPEQPRRTSRGRPKQTPKPRKSAARKQAPGGGVIDDEAEGEDEEDEDEEDEDEDDDEDEEGEESDE